MRIITGEEIFERADALLGKVNIGDCIRKDYAWWVRGDILEKGQEANPMVSVFFECLKTATATYMRDFEGRELFDKYISLNGREEGADHFIKLLRDFIAKLERLEYVNPVWIIEYAERIFKLLVELERAKFTLHLRNETYYKAIEMELLERAAYDYIAQHIELQKVIPEKPEADDK